MGYGHGGEERRNNCKTIFSEIETAEFKFHSDILNGL